MPNQFNYMGIICNTDSTFPVKYWGVGDYRHTAYKELYIFVYFIKYYEICPEDDRSIMVLVVS